MTEDTSNYWRKLLGLNQPLPADPLKKYRTDLSLLRPFLYVLLRAVSWLLFPLKAKGISNALIDPPFILCSNHVSTLDYGVLMLDLPNEVKFRFYAQAAKDYYDHPIARFFMRSFSNVIRVDREGDFFPALRSAAEVLRAGEPIYIAPEAARSGSGELLPFKMGVGALAVELGVKVVPAYIKGTHEAMPIGRVIPKRTEIEVIFGEAIDPKPYIEMKKTRQAYDVYQEFMQELRRRIVELSK